MNDLLTGINPRGFEQHPDKLQRLWQLSNYHSFMVEGLSDNSKPLIYPSSTGMLDNSSIVLTSTHQTGLQRGNAAINDGGKIEKAT